MNPEQWLASDQETLNILKAVQQLDLDDWWVCAGYVRKKIWDELSRKKEFVPLADIDVIYFDPADIREEAEKVHKQELHRLLPCPGLLKIRRVCIWLMELNRMNLPGMRLPSSRKPLLHLGSS